MNPLHWHPATKATAIVTLLALLLVIYFISRGDETTTVITVPPEESPVQSIEGGGSGDYSDIPGNQDKRGELVVYPESKKSEAAIEQGGVSYQVYQAGTTSAGVVVDPVENIVAAPMAPRLRGGPRGVTRNRSPRFAWREEGRFRCSLNTPSIRKAFICSSPQRITDLVDGKYIFRVWNVSGSSASPAAVRAFRVDASRPKPPQITSGPSGLTSNAQPSFRFRAKGKVGFLCSIDSEDYRACSSPFTTPLLEDGRHVFRVRTVDSAGNRSREIKKRVFQVDATPPAQPTILSGPEGDTIEFVFEGPAEAELLCSLGDAKEACVSPLLYEGLAPGEYTFRVWARDEAGNLSEPAAWNFEVPEVVAARSLSLSRSSSLNPASYSTGDTFSAAGEQQGLSLEIDPAIEILAIGSDSDTVSPQAGGDAGAGDDALFEANVDLRSNLAWTSTASESESFGLQAGSMTITGDGDAGGSNGFELAGDGVQEYTVQYAIDVSWADDASEEGAPYDATVDHDVSNALGG